MRARLCSARACAGEKAHSGSNGQREPLPPGKQHQKDYGSGGNIGKQTQKDELERSRVQVRVRGRSVFFFFGIMGRHPTSCTYRSDIGARAGREPIEGARDCADDALCHSLGAVLGVKHALALQPQALQYCLRGRCACCGEGRNEGHARKSETFGHARVYTL